MRESPIIGGEQFLPFASSHDNFQQLFQNTMGNTQFYASGRDAVFAILKHISPPKVWYPNFLCKSVFDAIEETGVKSSPYPIGEDLEPSDHGLEGIGPNDTVFLIHYFGRPQSRTLMSLQQRGAVIVSDASHLLQSEEAWHEVVGGSTWVLGSLRKCGPFPDGAFCFSPRGLLAPTPHKGPRDEVWVPRAAALLTRGASMAHGYPNDESFPLVQIAEKRLDQSRAGSYAMSYLSQALLEAIPLGSKRARAAVNTEILRETLPSHLIHPLSLKGTGSIFLCHFPSLELRNAARFRAAENQIYLPVHWDTSFLHSPHPLSNRIISIPCDSRYSEQDMRRVADLLRGQY